MKTLCLEPPLELSLGLRHDDTLVAPAAPAVGDEVQLSLWVADSAGLRAAALRCAPDGEEELHALSPVERRAGHTRYACTLRPRVARLRYRFRLELAGRGALHLAADGLHAFDPVDAFDFTLLLGARLPEWPLSSVLYQIFPDRFDDGDAESNVRDGQWSLRGRPTRARPFGSLPLPYDEAGNLDFCGGDLKGVERRLPHLQELGVNGLFLNPIWPALSNHRYDLIDHARVDPHLGGDAALASLCASLRARGMRVLLDAVINHTGSGHPWFNRDGLHEDGGAYRDRDDPRHDFYLFDRWPDGYRAWLGYDTLPRLDLTNPKVLEVIYGGEDSFLKKFLRPPFSVDGYRFDVANMIGRDGREQGHRALWSALCGALRGERDELYLLGEHFFDPDKLLKGDGLDGVMAYHAFTLPVRAFLLRRDRRGADSALDAAGLSLHLRRAIARVGWQAFRRCTLHLNSHDLPRVQTDGGGLPTAGGRGALELGTALQLFLPGVPCLYYGDEIGMEGGRDPDNRRCMEWDPRRWDLPWLERVTRSIRRRRESPALSHGGLVDLGSRGDVLALARVVDGEARLLLASRSDEPVRVDVDLRGLSACAPELPERLSVTLAPWDAQLI